MLYDLNFVQCFPTTLFLDNQSANRLVKNPVFHKRSKHIDVRCHFIRELIENKELIVKYIATTEKKADLFTKAFPKARFLYLCDLLNLLKRKDFGK